MFPSSVKPTRITCAAAHSRRTTRTWRAGGTFFSAETTSGTLPNGSMTRISRIVAEKSSAFIRESYGLAGGSAAFQSRVERAAMG